MRLKIEKKGFLLIEVMASILIISVSFIFIMRSFSVALKVLKVSEDNFSAVLLMEEIMWPFEEKGIDEGTFNGTLKDEKFSWETVAEPDYEDFDIYKIDKVTARILWKSQGADSLFKIVTFLNKI